MLETGMTILFIALQAWRRLVPIALPPGYNFRRIAGILGGTRGDETINVS